MNLSGIWWSADPGVKYVAYAMWLGSSLGATGMSALGGFSPMTRDLIVLEKPQVYRNSPARNADIVDLAMAAATIGAQFKEVVWYLPREWKGQIPKTIHHRRIRGQLTDLEHRALPIKKSELKHVLDAVGIGLYHMQAIGVKRGT